MKLPKGFENASVVAVERYKGFKIIVTDCANGFDLPTYFWFVCDREKIISSNDKDCGEDCLVDAVDRAKTITDNFL